MSTNKLLKKDFCLFHFFGIDLEETSHCRDILFDTCVITLNIHTYGKQSFDASCKELEMNDKVFEKYVNR